MGYIVCQFRAVAGLTEINGRRAVGTVVPSSHDFASLGGTRRAITSHASMDHHLLTLLTLLTLLRSTDVKALGVVHVPTESMSRIMGHL